MATKTYNCLFVNKNNKWFLRKFSINIPLTKEISKYLDMLDKLVYLNKNERFESEYGHKELRLILSTKISNKESGLISPIDWLYKCRHLYQIYYCNNIYQIVFQSTKEEIVLIPWWIEIFFHKNIYIYLPLN